MAIATEIAAALVVALNNHTFSPVLTAVRAYAPAFDLKDMDTLHVTVVPTSSVQGVSDRGFSLQTDIEIEVAVQQKLSDDATEDITDLDALMALVEDIALFVKDAGKMAAAAWIGTENTPTYSLEHLKQERLFTSVLTFTYRIFIR